MIVFPKTLEQARAAEGRLRAGGTDLQELRHRGIAPGPLVDLRDLDGLRDIVPLADGGLRVGALVTVAELASDPLVRRGWPAVAAAALSLATPQIRTRATVGGALLQDVRCWYYRSPGFRCLKRGGESCPARAGDHLFHACVEQGPCIAPHPSTLAVALLAFDATVEVDGEARTVPELLGDGRDPRQTHAVKPGAVLEAVRLPPPVPGEHSGYQRAIHRARAEWPLVEVVVRAGVEDGRLAHAVLVAGALANRPLRLDAAGLVGVAVDDDEALLAALPAVEASANLPLSAYKSRLVRPTLLDALREALGSPPAEGAESEPVADEEVVP